jgi:DNA-binding CsgD family transcriptional regulator
VKLDRQPSNIMVFNRQCAELERLIARVRFKRGGSLVVRGEAGAGKTMLLGQAHDLAPECRVVRIAGVEAERELALAAVHRLCEQIIDGLERLPHPQAESLKAAFGLSAAGSPDRLLLGLAVRNLLAEAADPRPLVCLVDDAQWLDEPSAQVLAFVARRLDALPVGIVFAERGQRDALVGLPVAEVAGLSSVEARSLIDQTFPGPLDQEVRARIAAETEGNPVAIAELLSRLRPEMIAGGYGAPSAIPLPPALERAFRDQLEALPGEVRQAMLVVAAEPRGKPGPVWQAMDALALTTAAVGSFEEDGLVRIDALVRFRHPAMRSVVYRAAPPADRRRAHRALAEATDPETDPERRAWHRGEAASGPDEEIASDLERHAGVAQDKGGWTAAAVLLGRAAALTPDPTRRAQRLLVAGQAKLAAGDLDEAMRLLARSDSRLLATRQAAQLEQSLAQVSSALRGGSGAVSLLLATAQRLTVVDVSLARETYLAALESAIQAGHLSGGPGVLEAATTALTAPPAPDPGRPIDQLLDGLVVLFTDGRAAGVPVLKHALHVLEAEENPRWLSLGAGIALEQWADAAARALATRQRDLALRTGALTALEESVQVLALLDVHDGNFAAAAGLIEQEGVMPSPAACAAGTMAGLLLSAYCGRETAGLQHFEQTIDRASAQADGRVVAFAETTKALLHNGLGHYRDAIAAAQRACEHGVWGVSDQALMELVEAAARCGEWEIGHAALRQLREHTRASGTDWALGVEARSRALLSDGQVADELYRSAIECLSRCSVTTALARAHLVYGEWLRREARRVEARLQLRIAHQMFTDMGAHAFAERAQRELLATGERLRKRRTESNKQLTSQEAQISRLARDGHSNPEIAVTLHISPRTVEYHLTKIFNKLGISSRNQLHRVLAASEASYPA